MLSFASKRIVYATAFAFAAALVVLASAAQVRAEVALPDVLSDSMVLQRGVRVPVWSTAASGEAVTVSFAARYAFNNNLRRSNLTNDTGLPAAPFRTDDWPGLTDGKR
ncbi:MAG: sialate O-acetylesterase [Acidobacteriota bacterium]|jgi:hypothetical protein|nr:sialate O-acetylesterase [Acidobacteriota bacterium]